jgi:hypothetical protein
MPAAKERDMSNEEQRQHVMAWAQDAVDSREIDELRQQIAEFAQERGNFARTIFELRGTIEQGKAANEAQIHEIGNLRDHSYKQADRIKELQEDRNRHKKFADVASTEYHKLSQEAARLREALEQVREGKEFVEYGDYFLFGDAAIRYLRQRVAELEREEAPWHKVNNTLYAENTELRETLKKVREKIDGFYDFKNTVDSIDNALAGAKGAEDETGRRSMAELTRYTDRMIRDSTPMPWDFYRADEVDAMLRKRATYERESRRNALSQASSHIKQLQHDLDAAYVALREFRAAFEDECNEHQRARYLEGIGGSEGLISEDEFTSYPFYVRHAEALKKAEEG